MRFVFTIMRLFECIQIDGVMRPLISAKAAASNCHIGFYMYDDSNAGFLAKTLCEDANAASDEFQA